MTEGKPVYRRILLKLSGEALAGGNLHGIDPGMVVSIADQIKEVKDLGVEIALVIGGGNIFRGMDNTYGIIDRTAADYMGMLATVINAIALQDAFEKMGMVTRVQTAISINSVAEPFIRRRAIRHLEKGRVVIFAAGTGNPYFSTDTASILRAAEMSCNVILKATKVEGVYDSDPMLNPNAKKFDEISYIEVLNLGLRVMDPTAISLCMENHLRLIVFNLLQTGNIKRAVMGERIGTVIRE